MMDDRTIEIKVHFDEKNKTVMISSYEPETSISTEIGTFPFHGHGEAILENVGDDIYSWISLWIDGIDGIEDECP